MDKLELAQQENLRRARAAAELASRGLYRCMGRCKQTRPLQEGIVVTWGGNVIFSICPECFSGVPVIMEEVTRAGGGKGLAIRPLRESDRHEPQIVTASSLSDVKELVPKAALAQFEKLDMGDE